MSIKLLSVKEISNQDVVYGIFYCKYKELKKTKYGDRYINIGLSDNSGSLNSKVWENSEFYHSKFSEGDIVAVKGTPNLYRSKIELNIAHISKCDSSKYEKYGFDPTMIIPKIDLDSKILWKEISAYFKKTGNRQALIKKMYSDYKESIVLFPSNTEPGFQVEGSYLRDISKALSIADTLLNSVSDKELIDHELIYSLIFLIRFDLITGYDKDIVYKVNNEASDRGFLAVFYDAFKKYRKLIDKKLFFTIEKCVFDSECEDFVLEKKITKEIFSLISYVD